MQARMAMCHGEDCKPTKKKHWNLEMTKEGSKYYCKSCLVKFKRRKAQRYALYEFIKEQRKISYPTGRMLKQIKDLTERGYTYFGIHQSLIFMIEVKHKPLDHNYFLGYVPYIYEDAKQWYIEKDTNKREQQRKGYAKKEQPTKIKFDYQLNTNKSKDLISADDLLD